MEVGNHVKMLQYFLQLIAARSGRGERKAQLRGREAPRELHGRQDAREARHCRRLEVHLKQSINPSFGPNTNERHMKIT